MTSRLIKFIMIINEKMRKRNSNNVFCFSSNSNSNGAWIQYSLPKHLVRIKYSKNIIVLIYSKPLNKKNTLQKLYFALFILLMLILRLSLPIYSPIIARLEFYVKFVDFSESPQDDVSRHSNRQHCLISSVSRAFL